MTFEEWFKANKDEISPLLRGDEMEALYRAWLAGYEAGLAEMGKFAKQLWNLR